ncbi:MAG: SH3 domain-containing protein [Anaerolineae bacterium]|nr:SH3 domain-containing protein [Anaerolineae bacterium]
MFKRKNQIQDMDAYVEERLSDFLDGTLSDQEQEIVKAHLASSERARASYESLQYTVSLLKQTSAPVLPRQFTLPVTSHAPARATPAWLVWGLRGVAVAATAAFVLLLTATLFRQTSPNQALEQAAPMAAAQPSPSVMIALAPTPLPTFPAQSQSDQVVTQTLPTASPIMITIEPPTDTPEPVSTLAPVPAESNKAQPTGLPSAPAQAPLPAAAPPEPTVAVSAELAPPTPTAVRETTDASAAGSVLNQNTPVPQPATSESNAQRTTRAVAVGGIITATQLRVRTGPGIEYPPIGELKSGDIVKILGRDESSAWLVIEYPQNLETGIGWIGALFVKHDPPINSLPVYEPQEPITTENEPTTQVPEPTETSVNDSTPTRTPTETPTDKPAPVPTRDSDEPIAPDITETPEP